MNKVDFCPVCDCATMVNDLDGNRVCLKRKCNSESDLNDIIEDIKEIIEKKQ